VVGVGDDDVGAGQDLGQGGTKRPEGIADRDQDVPSSDVSTGGMCDARHREQRTRAVQAIEDVPTFPVDA
jgi:hypothetical protein